MSTLATVWVRDPQLAATPRWARTPTPVEVLKPPEASKPAVNETVVSSLVGNNLKRLRKQHRLSLEDLATHSGVSRAMLGQIEQGKSIPSIKTLWQVAQALGVSVSWFLEASHDTKVLLLPPAADSPLNLRHSEGELRSLQQTVDGNADAFYELRLAPGALMRVPVTPLARRVNLSVSAGVLEVVVDEQPYLVRPREALQYEAHNVLVWRNTGQVQVQAFVVVRALTQSS
jgi:transcriptional regulator with XRE-family HTH domain